MRLILLFTTFPVRTETFLQREVEALIAADREIEMWSFWGGSESFKDRSIRRTSLWQIWKLLLALPYWFVRSPGSCLHLIAGMGRLRWRNATNFGENLLGCIYGCIHARRLEREATPETVLHAVWASLPASFGMVVNRLTGIPFSFSGHAYDLFEDGGDGWIGEKIASAFALRTSTQAGAERFFHFGADERTVRVIRRGLSEMPEFQPKLIRDEHLRMAFVGRFVPKMGFGLLGDVLDYLSAKGEAFEIRIIGDGPGKAAFEMRARQAIWSEHITFLGAQPFEQVLELLKWSDVLLFTGEAAESGDQAGFPNIIGEAMALGRPVLATSVGGVSEVIKPEMTGVIADAPESFYTALIELKQSGEAWEKQLQNARLWVENHFDAHANMTEFWLYLEEGIRRD